METTTPTQVPDEEFSNRKLIRPTLTRPEQSPRGERPRGLTARRPSLTPSEQQTHAENFYYQKQIQAKTQLTVVLADGEELTGYLEWYDRNCIKLNRPGQSNVLIYKPNIKYLYKTSENESGNHNK